MESTQNVADRDPAQELTFGQKAAGVSFNPSNNSHVNFIKSRFAEIIDYCNGERAASDNADVKRYLSKAISHAEDAQMNAVKAITWQH
jgi:hypothetical protein